MGFEIIEGSLKMKTKRKDKLFGIFGLTCKAVFHLLGLIAAYKWNVKLFIFLIGLMVLHNIVSLVFIKHRTGKWQVEYQVKNLKS